MALAGSPGAGKRVEALFQAEHSTTVNLALENWLAHLLKQLRIVLQDRLGWQRTHAFVELVVGDRRHDQARIVIIDRDVEVRTVLMSARDWGDVVKAEEVEIFEGLVLRILKIARAFSIHISWQLCLPDLLLDLQELLLTMLKSNMPLLGDRDELI